MGYNSSSTEPTSTIQFITNGLLGCATFCLNLLTIISILVSRCLPLRQKVCLSSVIITDIFLGLQILSVRLLPIQYDSSHFLCQIRLYSGLILAMVTIFSNLMITTERFMCMVMPFNYDKRITWQKLLICSGCIWMVSITGIGSLFHEGFGGNKVCQFLVCGSSNGYIVVGFFTCSISIINLLLYIYIVKVTRRHYRQISSTMVGGTNAQDAKRFLSKKEIQTTITVGVIVMAFAVSYFPIGTYLQYYGFFLKDISNFTETNQSIFTVLVTFFIFNSFVNPIVYIWRLKSVRAEMIARIMRRSLPESVE